jgi:hypothetical protein
MIGHDGALRTEEMSLATILRMHGYEPRMERKSERVIVWVIDRDNVDEYLEDLLAEYLSGEVRIEPRRFLQEFGLVRKELYNFLDIRQSNARRPVRRFAVADDASS